MVLGLFIGFSFVQYSSQVQQLLPYLAQQQNVFLDTISSLPTRSSALLTRTENDARKNNNNNNDEKSTQCHTWDVNTDEWWTHHPDWRVSFENDSHYCFTPISNNIEKAHLYRTLYDIQFSPTTNCSNVITKRMISSGWGTDLIYVLDGLRYALATQRPMQMFTYTWHYAVVHNRSACPSQDMFCYFLNLTHCPPNPSDMGRMRYSKNVSHFGIPNRWLIEYMTRPQTWLRHASYLFAKERLRIHAAGSRIISSSSSSMEATMHRNSTTPKYDDSKLFHPFGTAAAAAAAVTTQPTDPTILASRASSLSTFSCVAMHVRRADVVLHRKHSRRYHAISEYIDALHRVASQQYPKDNPLINHQYHFHHRHYNNQNMNITNTTTFLLLTDDANAIGEALVEHGKSYTWIYLDRPRHRGAEGGFENQIPSGDPRMEVVAMLAEARILRQCATSLIFSTSSLAYYFIGMLEEKFHPTTSNLVEGRPDQSPHVAPQPLLINLDVGQHRSDVRSKENTLTKNISRTYLP